MIDYMVPILRIAQSEDEDPIFFKHTRQGKKRC